MQTPFGGDQCGDGALPELRPFGQERLSEQAGSRYCRKRGRSSRSRKEQAGTSFDPHRMFTDTVHFLPGKRQHNSRKAHACLRLPRRPEEALHTHTLATHPGRGADRLSPPGMHCEVGAQAAPAQSRCDGSQDLDIKCSFGWRTQLLCGYLTPTDNVCKLQSHSQDTCMNIADRLSDTCRTALGLCSSSVMLMTDYKVELRTFGKNTACTPLDVICRLEECPSSHSSGCLLTAQT